MNLSFDRENQFKNSNITSMGGSKDDIIIEKFGGQGGASSVHQSESPRLIPVQLPEKKTKFIPPQLSSKSVPMDSFGGLINQKKTSTNSVSSDSVSSGSGSSYIDDSSSESSSEENFSNSQFQSSSPKNKYASSVEDDSDDDSDEEDSSDEESSSGSEITSSSISESSYDESSRGGGRGYIDEPPQKTYEEIQKEKQQILFELDRLQKQGYPPSKRYNMASTIEDMKYERDKLKKQRDVEKSIKFSRKALMMCVSGIEFVNGKFDPFDVKLEGWSEKVMEDITDYDEIFEELHEKYGESVKMAPELRLLGTVASSAFMFHLTNSLFKSATPDLNDILKKNPDIMRNIQEAAARNMSQTINQQYGVNDPIGNIMKQGIQQKMGQQQGPPPPMPMRVPPRSPMPMGPSRPLNSTPQQTMRGPNGVDDLLNQLNESSSTRDDDSMSESSLNMRSFGRKGAIKKSKKGGIEIDLA